MRKQIERIQQYATLTCDETRVYKVYCDIAVYQTYVDTGGYSGEHHTPGGFEVTGTITPDNLPAQTPAGRSNILDLGNGRKLDIGFHGQWLVRFKSKTFSIHDEMTFFDAPLYRRLEEEQG